MALVYHRSDRTTEDCPEKPALQASELPPETPASGTAVSVQEESWLARLDEVFAETGWPDA